MRWRIRRVRRLSGQVVSTDRSPRPARGPDHSRAPARALKLPPIAQRDIFHRSEYLSPDSEAAQLTLTADGLPTARLVRKRDRLVLVTDQGGIVNPKSRSQHRLGLYSFTIRGTSHYGNAMLRGDFQPGAPVRIVREPDNPYDANAIAIYAKGARKKAGYVNKLNAKRIAPHLDAGRDMVAISTRGGAAGKDGHVPQILVTERRVLDHLLR